MSDVFVSLMFGVGLAAWVYYKAMYQTGGIVKTSLTAAGVVGLLAFVMLFTFMALVLKI